MNRISAKLGPIFKKFKKFFSMNRISEKLELILRKVLVAVGYAYALISTEDFWRDIISKCWDFVLETDDHEIGFLSDSGSGNMDESGSYIHQGENTIVVEYELGEDGYYVFFKTKDPKMVFPYNIKVGSSLNAILDGKKKIPGKITKLNILEDVQYCQWKFEENVTFTIYAKEDAITEFVYYNPTIQGSDKGYVDVKKLNYVERKL
ncbi:MAG: hypothetical protein FWE49_05245 [Synergistaceae bacterium]|nr:hypothetical protein [Synergistaceae bacterium]